MIINVIFSNRGEKGSSASAIRKGSHKFARKPDYMFIAQLEYLELEIVYLETGKPDSTNTKRQQDHKKLVRFSKDSIDAIKNSSKYRRIREKIQELPIFTINIAGILL